MKVKELQKCVNVAWSPAQQNSIMLAAGTAAQQTDFSTGSLIEIYSANLTDPGYDFELKASQSSQYKFEKIIWSPAGYGSSNPNGLIVGGCEGGHLQVYSGFKLLAGQEALLAQQDKHNGSVRGLDFNPFQHNLLASGASESEIFVWDLNNTSTPMTPGAKTQPLEDIQSVAWNRQVQHILASVFSSRCVIWDLRKNEQIMKLSDTQSRVRWRSIQWHPDIATQLWLASEEDQAPYIQLWDLRYATAPAKTLQIHNRGVLSLTWCPKDSNMMISCGKDNKIYCWNPNTELLEGEILGEVASSIQWYSDVQWCPRNPALIASSSLEGNVSVYSLFGGTHQQVQTTNKIADSFPGMDEISQAPIPQQTTQVVYSDLKRAPKWMKKAAGVSFGFGGRLIAFNDTAENITISQVVTEPELVERANALEKTLEEGNFAEYCKFKADQMENQHGRYLWYFIKANFDLNPREEMLNLLGYNKEDVGNKFQKYVKQEDASNQNTIENLTNKMGTLNHSDSSEVECDQSTDDSTDLSGTDNNVLFDAIAAGNKVLTELTEKKLVKYKIPNGEDNEGLISSAILSGNIEAAVELCIESGRSAEALIIASTAGIDFLTKTQNNYLKKQENELANIILALVTRDWVEVMTQCSVESWKEVLVAALTHSDAQIGNLCVKLGERLQAECTDAALARNAILCYICAGNLEKLVEGWLQLRNHDNLNSKLSTTELQELVEIIMLLKKSLELRGQQVEPTGKLAEFLSQYAGLLAGQGALETALAYLGPTVDPELEDLRERLYYALGHKQQYNHQSQNQSYSRNTNLNSYYGNAPMNVTNTRLNQPRNSFSNTMPSMNQPPQNYNSSLQMNASFQPPVPSQQNWTPQQNISSFNTMQQQQLNHNVSQAPPPPTINESMNYPQRPSSVGSQGSCGGPLTRSKYIVDPSVSSTPSYGQSIFNQAPTNLTGPPQQFNGNTLPSNNYAQVQQLPMMPQQSTYKPFAPAQNPISNLGSNQSANYLSGLPPIESANEVLPPPPSMHKNPTPPPGWNDPPPLSSSARVNTKPDHSKLHPITHPIFGVDPNRNQNGFIDPNSQYQNQMFQSNPMPQHMYPLQQEQQQGISAPPQMLTPLTTMVSEQSHQELDNWKQNTSNQTNFKTQAIPSQMYKPQQQLGSNLETTQSPKHHMQTDKPPLPEQFIYMQTVLEELKNLCLSAANDPRTKRKFSDVAKRLECLYDILREGRLSINTINSLNQIVQYLQTGDYGNALATHTQIVSGPDFSQTATFMPGIKILVQSASELKVYLR